VPPPAHAQHTTSTTIAGIAGHIPKTPTTVPLTTRKPNAHFSPVFAELSAAGFALVVLMLLVQVVLTRRHRRGRWTL
ncbi:MAG: hypothetical protein ACRDPD_09035, partial [Streptosporangiaceae bacterium]